jgi:hypothetical protein
MARLLLEYIRDGSGLTEKERRTRFLQVRCIRLLQARRTRLLQARRMRLFVAMIHQPFGWL